MKPDINEIQTWKGQLDERGRLQVPQEVRQTIGWTVPSDVIVESDGISLRVMPVEQYYAEITVSR